MSEAVKRAARLGKPIYIMENGVPDAEDQIRPWLIVNVLRELHRLIAEHYDIRGYLHWTLTDNFEWNEGWKLRFGLVALDPETQLRTLRGSATLFRDIIRGNGLAVATDDASPAFSTTRALMLVLKRAAGRSRQVTLLFPPAFIHGKLMEC